MSVRKSKPYSTPKRTVKRKNDNANKNFDVTTRIRVDEVRLNDSDSLDTSFLEGRVERQSKKDTKYWHFMRLHIPTMEALYNHSKE